jgi:hypothetical protein
MGRLDTAEIMAVALRQAGLDRVPADSTVYVPGDGLKRALFAIDVDAGDLLYAKDAGFDVVVAHHPVGGSPLSPAFTDVMWRQVEQMVEAGVAEPVARSAVAERVATVHRRRHMLNYNRVLDTARLIGLPLLNIHLPPDIVSRRFVQALVAEVATPETPVGILLDALASVPEMAASLTPPELWIGEPENPCGQVAVMMAGGTNGGYPVFKALYDVGVGTILAMHIDEGDFLRLRSEAPDGRNFLVTGHMASDSIGINRLIWGLEDAGLDCLRTSGVIGAPRPAPA